MKKSLGLIETQGLAAGIEAADAAVKSANVELIGYELTKGGGWTTIKIQGDVGAVKAAVDAARMAAAKVNQVVSTRVIPRPSAGLDILVHNPDTVGDSPRVTDKPEPPTPPKKKLKEEKDLPTEPEGLDAGQTKESLPDIPKEEEAEQKKESPPDEGPEESDRQQAETTDVLPQEPEEQSDTTQPDGIETSQEDEQPDAVNTKADVEEVSKEQKSQTPVVKPVRKPAAQKGRKTGKRGSKHETTE